MKKIYLIFYSISLVLLFIACNYNTEIIEKIPQIENKYDPGKPTGVDEIIPNKGVIDQTFIINIEGRLAEYDPGQNKETYKSFNESMVNLNSYPTREIELEYGFVPRYMSEKLNLALAHETFKVNDVEYQSDGGPDAELISDGDWITNMYKGKVKLQQVTYEDYTNVTDDIEPTINPILVDEFETVLIITDSGTDFYAEYKD